MSDEDNVYVQGHVIPEKLFNELKTIPGMFNDVSGCKVCGRNLSLRLGVCFDCAESESIMVNGLDMFDKPVPMVFPGNSKELNRLKAILDKYMVGRK